VFAKLHPSLIIMLMAASTALAALATAWTAQYGFGLYPCELCLYQRLPYIGVVCLSALTFMPIVDPKARQLACFICGLLFLMTASIAFFHIGVEKEWWQSICAPTGGQSFSIDDIRSALLQPGLPACNDIQFTLLGLPMTVYNMFSGLIFAAASLCAARNETFWCE
jgi:disulfide bond formation protein DsbB